MPDPSAASETQRREIQVSLANEQSSHAVDEQQLLEAAKAVLSESAFTSAAISLAVVDDETMRQLNQTYLEHDCPTDVLSFVLKDDKAHLEGEVIISADTAAAAAVEIGWTAATEQLLYVIHGTLHLIGYRDKTPSEIEQMREAEAKYMRQFDFEHIRELGDGDVLSNPRAIDSARGATGR